MQQQSPTPNRLTRDTTNHMIGGVCAGIARQYGYDVTVVRIVAILLTLVWGAGLLLYLALWVIMPADAPASAAATSLPAPEAGSRTDGAAAAGTAFAPGSGDDLAERARRAADDFAIAARSAAEAARVAAEQLAEVAKAATAAGRESWDQQRAARSEAERTDTTAASASTASSSAPAAPGVTDAPPSPAAPSAPEHETTPPSA
jgi:phage shock protein C